MNQPLKENPQKRIAFLTYSRLYNLLTLTSEKEDFENIRIISSNFNDTLQIVRGLIDKNMIDIAIAGGSNARLIKENFPNLPIVTLKVSGFDLLSACEKAKQHSTNIAIVTYKAGAMWAPKMEQYSKSLNINIMNIQYYKMNDLTNIMNYLKRNNFYSVVGASVACDYAEQAGLNPVLVYSEDSIREGVREAQNLYNNIKHEKKNNNYLQAIIEFTNSGIIAIDKQKKIKICNPVAENILKLKKNDVLDKEISSFLPFSGLEKVMETGVLETNTIQHIDNNTIINKNVVPIFVDGNIVGAIATFNDIAEIQKVEHNIRKNIHFKKGLQARYVFDNIKGESETIKRAIHLAKIYAKSHQTVLIYGETGTGKELFTHSIHNHSDRSDKPFVAINCAALPANLLESELFGYEGGAFTGAKKDGKPGLFELAHQGTILLDEISEMPLELQTRLLRVIQEKEILRIGGNKIIPIDVRVIATTNDNLKYKVDNNKFRQDLYYRLNVLNLTIPPLRDRLEDVPFIVKEIVKKTSPAQYDKCNVILDAINSNFYGYTWPGNIRQLENAVQRLCVIFESGSDNAIIYKDILEQAVDLDSSLTHVSSKTNDEKAELLNALEEVQWNRQKAAELLGISRTTLWRKIKNLNIKPASTN